MGRRKEQGGGGKIEDSRVGAAHYLSPPLPLPFLLPSSPEVVYIVNIQKMRERYFTINSYYAMKHRESV